MRQPEQGMNMSLFHVIPALYSADSGRTEKTEVRVSSNYDSEILLKCCSTPNQSDAY